MLLLVCVNLGDRLKGLFNVAKILALTFTFLSNVQRNISVDPTRQKD